MLRDRSNMAPEQPATIAFEHNPFLLRDKRRGSDAAGEVVAVPTVALTLYSSTTNHTHSAEGEVRKIKHLLDAKRIEYEEVFLDLEPERRAAMESCSRRTELPQLLVGNKFHGGWQKLQDMEDDGALDIVLEGAPRRPPSPPMPGRAGAELGEGSTGGGSVVSPSACIRRGSVASFADLWQA